MQKENAEELSGKMAQTLETKSRILKAALKLFNEEGTDSITTHDIAHQADISPGNLYYHFKNKQAIIRALFYEIEVFSITEWWEKSPNHKDVRFADFMQFYFGSLSKYRFFFRDFSSILSNDPILAREWKSKYLRLFSVMQEVLHGWVKQGLIKPFRSAKEADIFIESVWVLAAFSQVHLEALGKSKSGSLEEANKYVARFLYPYHTEKGQRVIDLYL